MSEAIERPRIDVPMTDRIKALPRDRRGFVVPWFVPYVDGEAYFPGLDTRKLVLAVKQKRCWICGQTLGRWLAFCVGPMCVANRISAEPPSHLDCAQYALRVCPFMTNPQMRRVPEAKHPDGYTISEAHDPRNPGIMALFVTRSYRPITDGAGHPLISMGPPDGGVSWWTRGREATRDEVEPALASGMVKLTEAATKECNGTLNAEAKAELDRMHKRAYATLPKG